MCKETLFKVESIKQCRNWLGWCQKRRNFNILPSCSLSVSFSAIYDSSTGTDFYKTISVCGLMHVLQKRPRAQADLLLESSIFLTQKWNSTFFVEARSAPKFGQTFQAQQPELLQKIMSSVYREAVGLYSLTHGRPLEHRYRTIIRQQQYSASMPTLYYFRTRSII